MYGHPKKYFAEYKKKQAKRANLAAGNTADDKEDVPNGN